MNGIKYGALSGFWEIFVGFGREMTVSSAWKRVMGGRIYAAGVGNGGINLVDGRSMAYCLSLVFNTGVILLLYVKGFNEWMISMYLIQAQHTAISQPSFTELKTPTLAFSRSQGLLRGRKWLTATLVFHRGDLTSLDIENIARGTFCKLFSNEW